MFLFLSKLLPLLVYPLGLTSLLLVLAIVMLGFRQIKLAGSTVLMAFLILWLFSTGFVSQRLVASLEHRYDSTDLPPTAEAIVILGGSTYAPQDPRPGVEVNDAGDRLIYGARLFNAGKAPVVILSGGRLDWDRDPESLDSEAADMAVIVEALGVPESALILEPNSRNTYENAVNVQSILEQAEINSFLLVTSAMHMPRSMLIFQKLGLDPIPAPADFLIAHADLDAHYGEKALLDLLPDARNLERSTRALKEYLGILVYFLKGWI